MSTVLFDVMFDVYGFAGTLLVVRRTEYIHSCRRRTVGIVGVGKALHLMMHWSV